MSRGNKALVTGITGQDGSYLAEFLLAKVMKCMVWCAGPVPSIPGVLTICMWTRMKPGPVFFSIMAI